MDAEGVYLLCSLLLGEVSKEPVILGAEESLQGNDPPIVKATVISSAASSR